MTAPVVLLGFVVAALATGPLLARAAWPRRSPRWGIWAWQCLSTTAALAIVLTGITIALPALPVRARVADVFATTPVRVAEHYTTPGGMLLALTAAVATAVLTIRFTLVCGTHLARAHRLRSRQLAQLAVVGSARDGYVVVEHHTPLVYCVPGRGRTVVVTSAALGMLDAGQLDLVLAHERTHARARHDLALAMSAALARTFPRIHLFTRAHDSITTLVEMHADDAARRPRERRQLATALVVLCAGAPRGALGAGDTAALTRVRRLALEPARPLTTPQAGVVALVSVLALLAPVGLAALPAIEATIANCWEATHLGSRASS